MENNRRHQLKQFHQALNTAEGRALMEELKMAWHDGNPLDNEAATMGFNVGLNEAYKQLEVWQQGEGLYDKSTQLELEDMKEATHG